MYSIPRCLNAQPATCLVHPRQCLAQATGAQDQKGRSQKQTDTCGRARQNHFFQFIYSGLCHQRQISYARRSGKLIGLLLELICGCCVCQHVPSQLIFKVWKSCHLYMTEYPQPSYNLVTPSYIQPALCLLALLTPPELPQGSERRRHFRPSAHLLTSSRHIQLH